MIRKLILSGACVLALASAAGAQPAMTRHDGVADAMTTDFITKAAQSDEFERREGLIAERRAHNPLIRQFAAEMVRAHTQTTIGLKTAIRRAGLPVPPPPILTSDQVQMVGNLAGMHGGEFDRTYINQQVQAHQDTFGVVQGYAQNGHPGPIREAARKTAPLVQHHLDMAKDIQAHMGG